MALNKMSSSNSPTFTRVKVTRTISPATPPVIDPKEILKENLLRRILQQVRQSKS
jgi:hypothetical protein